MTQIPIFLYRLEELHSIPQTEYTPVSLRELFWFLRGSKNVSQNACLVLLQIPNESVLQSVLPFLQEAQMQTVLAVEEVLSARMCEQLLAMRHLTVIPVHNPQNDSHSDVVFCPTVDSDTLRTMRRNGVRMVIANESRSHIDVPSGMDLLYTTDWRTNHRACEQPLIAAKQPLFLPLDENPLFSAMHLAIPLSILGARQEKLHDALAFGLWSTEYRPDEDRYTVKADFSALQTVSCAMPQNIKDGFCRYLKDGNYIELQTDVHIPQVRGGGRILLYGYDRRVKTFAAQVALEHGTFDRVDMLEQTVEDICASSGTKLQLYLPKAEFERNTTECFVSALQSEIPPSNGVFYGKGAAVRYANRFYKRFSDGDPTMSADSLRMFLEERRRYGFAFWYLAKKEDFFLEPFESYLHMLAKLCKPAIDDLRGKTVLKPDMPLYLTSETMRKLLHTEEACVTAFLDEWERLSYRKVYLDRSV